MFNLLITILDKLIVQNKKQFRSFKENLLKKVVSNFVRHQGTDSGKKRTIEELHLNMTTPEQINKKAKFDEKS